MSLQIFYGLMAGCGLLAIIALMFFEEGDDSGDSSGVAWIVGLASWFVLGLGIGGSIGLVGGSPGWSICLGILAGVVCVFIARKTVGSLACFCKRNETEIPELRIGDVVIPLGDIKPGTYGKVESPIKKSLSGGGVTCFATVKDEPVLAGTRCVIVEMVADAAVIEKIGEKTA